jgi:long-chain fatty acid transport protein
MPRILPSGVARPPAPSIVCSLALAALVAAPRAAHASPEDVFGYGARSSALAGTGTASSEGFESVYSNPALLPYSHDTKLTLGMMGAAFELSANGRLLYKPLVGSIIGAVLPMPLPGVMKDRITLGFGFFTPFDLIVRGDILYPETKQFLLPDRTQSVAVQAGMGIDLSWWKNRPRSGGLHIGGGIAALAALDGHVLVAVDATGKIGSVVEDTLVASYAPIVGASLDIGEGWRAGLSFHGELVGRFNVEINVKDLGSITVPPLEISGVAQYDPHQLTAEFARTAGPIRGALSVTWKHWSAYGGAPEATVRCPLNPDTGQVDPCDALVPPDPDFHDTVVPRIAGEYVWSANRGVDVRFRAGYAFEMSPAPEQTFESNIFDEHRSIVGFGAGLDLSKPVVAGLSLDFFGQVQVMHGRTHTKIGHLGTDNPGFPSVETSGVVLAGGTQLGVGF